MKEGLSRALQRYLRSFAAFSAGQKMVAVIGTLALVLAGFMVFRWAATPSYSPLFSNLSSKDASAVIEQLDADGVPYEISAGGGTISVPRDAVYATRISLSGEGLPANSGEGGYALLDNQDISTSQFKEQTDFKRAMEGELANTIEAIDGVDTAVVHLALPPQEVFADEQAPATASVLVSTGPGGGLAPEQVQAVVHLVASSIDSLDPDQVTVADSTGRVLSTTGDADGLATSRAQQTADYQDELSAKVQSMLDRVLGPGHSTVQITANLDFDKSTTESTTYSNDEDAPALSESTQQETYSGGASPGDAGAGGVVGPDGQTEVGSGTGDGSYNNSSVMRDNGVDTVVERRETAPGGVETLHAGVVIDVNAPVKIDAAGVEDLVTAAIGLDVKRGDTFQVSAMPFDTTLATASEEAMAEADAEADAAQRMEWIRNGVLLLVVALLLLIVWLRGRKHAKARQNATTYVVEQLRADQADRAAVAAAAKHRIEASPATMALQQADHGGGLRDELSDLVERQPEEVAALLRGWLVERH